MTSAQSNFLFYLPTSAVSGYLRGSVLCSLSERVNERSVLHFLEIDIRPGSGRYATNLE
jgi:hypothetical protein